MQVIPEGVETAGQLERLIELGCDYAQGFYLSRPLAAAELEAGRCLERRRAARVPALGRPRRAFLRARHHGGRAARALGPRARDRDAHRRAARPRRRRPLGAVLRAAAQGRRLLEQRLAAVVAVRRRRPGDQARHEADRLVEVGQPGHVHLAGDRARRLPAGEGAPDARDHPGGGGHARDVRHALRARRRDRADARAPGADRRGDPLARRALGRQRPSASACAARRSRCSGGSCASRRPSRCSCARWARAARTGWRSSGAAAGSTRRWSTPCSPSATTRRSGARSRTPRAVPPRRGGSRRPVLLADEAQLDRVAEAFGRVIDAKSPFTARHSTGVAGVRGGDRRRDGDGRGRAARPAPRRAAARHRQAGRVRRGSSTSRAG